MDRRRFVFSLALVPILPLIPPQPHLRVILPEDCQIQELLQHLKQIAANGHYQDSLEFRLADGRRLAFDASFARRRVIEYDFTRGASVKPNFYTETAFLSSSVPPDAYYLFLCACMYTQRPLWGALEETKTVGQLVDQLPKVSRNMFASRVQGARESLKRTLIEKS